MRNWFLAAAAFGSLGLASVAGAQTDPDFAAHAGGTLKLVAVSAAGTIDPQVNYTQQYAQVFAVSYDGLVTFEKAGGADSTNIVPDLATALPTPQDGGLTYVFTLRPGITFSNGAPVTPDDVVATMQRLFKVNNPNAGSWYADFVGADKCLATPASCTLAGGVVADDKAGTVTFHLVKPDPEFFDQMAFPFASIVPADSPPHDVGTIPLPGTGAYVITSYDPQKGLVLKRNPYFKPWSAAAQPTGYVDEIDYTFGITTENEITAIENNQYDYKFDPAPADRLQEMGTRFTSRLHIEPDFADYYAPMNVNIPPFNNMDARLAVNYAFDRKAAVNIYGGRNLAVPNCQILPPGFPAYEPYCPYTLNPGTKWSAPDMAKAKALMAASGQIGQKVTVIVDDYGVDPAIGTYLASVLNGLGFVATTHVLSASIQFNYIQNSKNNVQISVSQWYDDYPAPSDFLRVLFTCAQIHPGSDNSVNIAEYCNKDYDAKVAAAAALTINNPAAANAAWAAVDKAATDASVWVTMFTPRTLDFVSTRLGNYTYSDQYTMLFDKVWVH